MMSSPMSDMELAEKFIEMIEKPPVVLDPQTGMVISPRKDNINEAKRALKTMKDPEAIEKLQEVIDKYPNI